jgi:hypothetical protein
VDGPEQQAPDETPKPPVHCLPRPEVDRQPPPASGAPGQAAHGVQHLTQIHRGLVAPPRSTRQQQLNPLPPLSVRSNW